MRDALFLLSLLATPALAQPSPRLGKRVTSVLSRMSSRSSTFETFVCFTPTILASASCETSNALQSSASVRSAAIV